MMSNPGPSQDPLALDAMIFISHDMWCVAPFSRDGKVRTTKVGNGNLAGLLH